MLSNRKNEETTELLELNPNENRKKQTANNQMAIAAVVATESLDLAAIYTMFLKPTLRALLEETAKFIMFPVAAAASIITAALIWRHAYLDRSKKDNIKSRNIVRAVVETVAAAAVTTAVIGGLAATAVFALATPIIFTATYAAKTLFNAGSAIYYLGKSVAAKDLDKKDLDKKQTYRKLAKGNAIAAVAGAIGTAIVASVFLFGKLVIAAAGVALSVFGAGYAVYLGYKGYKAKQKLKEEATPSNTETDEQDAEHKPEPENTLRNTQAIISALGISINNEQQPVTADPVTNIPGSPTWSRGEISDRKIIAGHRRKRTSQPTTLEEESTSRVSLRASVNHS